MKKLSLVVLSLILSLPVLAQDSSSVIYFYRPSKLKAASVDYSIYNDGKDIGKSRSGTILFYRSKPGLQAFKATTEAEGAITLDVKPRSTYYIECSISVNAAAGSPSFRQVSSAEAKKAFYAISPGNVALIVDDKPSTASPSESTSTSTSAKDEFGIKTGVNFSTLSASINSVSSATTGFHIGLYYKTAIGKNFFFRPEFLYSSQGQEDEFRITTNGPSFGSATTTINYFNIPMLFEAGNRVSLQFGPQIGFALSGRQKGSVGGTPVNDDLKSILKSPDLSLVFGLGLSPAKHFHLGIRYQLGMTSVFRTPNGAPPSYPDIKNRVFHAYAAVSF